MTSANTEQALDACGVRTIGVRTVEDLRIVDALVLPGGESTTMSKLAVTFDLIDPLREVVRRRYARCTAPAPE